jgi:glycosyltransferase involved in cell wall biosynthesis
MVQLTIGMATYKDFDGVYFTLQSLRLYQDLDETELLVVDNYGCEDTKRLVESWVKGRYILATDTVGTAPAKDLVFREAQGEAVLCCDSHVLFSPGVISRLKAYYRDHPDCDDLLQGPLVYDDLESLSTHFDPIWRGQMWGVWATDDRARDPDGEPFDIPMQGMGAFSCRKRAWLGFNPRFRGFGGEEGYIHEKFRQAGRRTLCMPWLRWTHRFGRPNGVPYPLTVDDKLRNYLIGHAELGLDLDPVISHFSDQLPEERIQSIMAEALQVTLVARPSTVPVIDASAARTDAAPAAPANVGLNAAEQPPNANTAPSDQPQAVPALIRGYPPVSCFCVTYGRPQLLEEAIQSFLLQDYPGEKELLIFNDLHQQQLIFEHPEVTVINVPRRFQLLGEKFNAAVALTTHDLIFVWDDDDIYLPHRLTLSVERFDTRKGFFKGDQAWFWNNGQLSGPEGNVFHGGSCWSRELFHSVRGYTAMGLGHDVDIETRFESARPGSVSGADLRPQDLYYIYRWGGTGSFHVSGFPQDQHRAVADFVSDQIRQGRIPVGEIRLNPRWHSDYVGLVRDYRASLLTATG